MWSNFCPFWDKQYLAEGQARAVCEKKLISELGQREGECWRRFCWPVFLFTNPRKTQKTRYQKDTSVDSIYYWKPPKTDNFSNQNGWILLPWSWLPLLNRVSLWHVYTVVDCIFVAMPCFFDLPRCPTVCVTNNLCFKKVKVISLLLFILSFFCLMAY